MEHIVRFILELDKLKGVTRKVKPVGLDRYENSAEYSWQIAMLAAALYPFAAGKLGLDRVIKMLLVHDIGEIDTGDTMVFVEEGAHERKVSERAAVRRIFDTLPAGEGASFVAIWEEFEEGVTPEARFAHAVDRAMSVILNLANQGQSWRENGSATIAWFRRFGLQSKRAVHRSGPTWRLSSSWPAPKAISAPDALWTTARWCGGVNTSGGRTSAPHEMV